jgi:hypothetical protein
VARLLWLQVPSLDRIERMPSFKIMPWVAALFLLCTLTAAAQDSQAPVAGDAQPGAGTGRERHQGGDDDNGGPRPVFGRIAAINDKSLRISRPDGSEQTVVINADTEFRRDRQPAKLKDFKVGDGVLIRGKENPDYSYTAQIVVGRGGNGNGGPGGPNRQNPVGTLGKDFVLGEVKALDPPSITVMRTDNVKQTFELNEDTSLHKGRDAITMADIQVGDHIFAHGGLQDNQFVPKNVAVISLEMWKRMQEAGVTSPSVGRSTQPHGAAAGGAATSAPNNAPTGGQGSAPGDPPSKPTEPPN